MHSPPGNFRISRALRSFVTRPAKLVDTKMYVDYVRKCFILVIDLFSVL